MDYQFFVIILHLIVTLLLIGAVLIQRSEGGALGVGGGGGGGLMSGRSAATTIQKATWGLAAAFVATSLTLAVLGADGRGLDTTSGAAPAGDLSIESLTQGSDAPETTPAEDGALPPAPLDDGSLPPASTDDGLGAAPSSTGDGTQ